MKQIIITDNIEGKNKLRKNVSDTVYNKLVEYQNLGGFKRYHVELYKELKAGEFVLSLSKSHNEVFEFLKEHAFMELSMDEIKKLFSNSK